MHVIFYCHNIFVKNKSIGLVYHLFLACPPCAGTFKQHHVRDMSYLSSANILMNEQILDKIC